jgi:hypothetical protein
MTKKNKKTGKKHPLDDRFYVRAFGRVYTKRELTDIVIRETLAPLAHETVDLDIVSGLWLRFVEDHVGLLEAIHERWLANCKTPMRQRDLYPFDLDFSQFLKPENHVARHVIMAMEATSQPMAFGDEAFMQALSILGGLDSVPLDTDTQLTGTALADLARRVLYSSAGCNVKVSNHVFFGLARNPDVNCRELLTRDDDHRVISAVGMGVLDDILLATRKTSPDGFLDDYVVEAAFNRVAPNMVIRVEVVSKSDENIQFSGSFKATKSSFDIWTPHSWSQRDRAPGGFIWRGSSFFGEGATIPPKVAASVAEYIFKYVFNPRSGAKEGTLQAIQDWLDFIYLATELTDPQMESTWNANSGNIYVMLQDTEPGKGIYKFPDIYPDSSDVD